MNSHDLIRKIISIESTVHAGNWELVQMLAQLGKDWGFCVEMMEESVAGKKEGNIILRPPPRPGLKTEKELLLETHLDTANAGNYSLWSKTDENPFNATFYSDDVYGLGVAASKLDFLCKMQAAKNFIGKDLVKPYVLVGSYGGEDGMPGIIKLVRRKKIQADQALIGEPTALSLGYAGLGIVVIEVSIPFSQQEADYRRDHDLLESGSTQSKMFVGKAGHLSTPGIQDNAIYKMLDFLDNLPEGIALMDVDGGVMHNAVPASAFLEFDIHGGVEHSMAKKLIHVYHLLKSFDQEFEKKFDKEFLPSYLTMNLGTVRTEGDFVRLSGNVRLLPSVDENIYKDWIELLKKSCSEIGAVLRVKDYKTPFYTERESPWINKCFSELGKIVAEPAWTKLSSCTEASPLSRLGLDCLVFGSGQGWGNSCAPNEKNNTKDIEKTTKFYSNIIESLCLNGECL